MDHIFPCMNISQLYPTCYSTRGGDTIFARNTSPGFYFLPSAGDLMSKINEMYWP